MNEMGEKKKREALQDQRRSGCLGLCAIGSRQQIDYRAETQIRCLSRISLPLTEHPRRTTILHPHAHFLDFLINTIPQAYKHRYPKSAKIYPPLNINPALLPSAESPHCCL